MSIPHDDDKKKSSRAPYTAIPNSLLEALAGADLKPLGFKIFLALLRASLGFGRDDADRLSVRGLARQVGRPYSGHFLKAVHDLRAAKMITTEPRLAPVVDPRLWRGVGLDATTGVEGDATPGVGLDDEWRRTRSQSGVGLDAYTKKERQRKEDKAAPASAPEGAPAPSREQVEAAFSEMWKKLGRPRCTDCDNTGWRKVGTEGVVRCECGRLGAGGAA